MTSGIGSFGGGETVRPDSFRKKVQSRTKL
jgi:hypothetical protein